MAEALPNYLFFLLNLCQFAKIYVTIFVPSRFWWIADYGFNGMKYIFIQVDPHVGYTKRFCG